MITCNLKLSEMDETEIMKHSEKYLQAKWVTENPDGYDERDVVDAKKYCNAYLDGYNQALRTPDVVGRSEQLFCEEHTPKVKYDWQKGNCLVCAKKLDAK